MRPRSFWYGFRRPRGCSWGKNFGALELAVGDFGGWRYKYEARRCVVPTKVWIRCALPFSMAAAWSQPVVQVPMLTAGRFLQGPFHLVESEPEDGCRGKTCPTIRHSANREREHTSICCLQSTKSPLRFRSRGLISRIPRRPRICFRIVRQQLRGAVLPFQVQGGGSRHVETTSISTSLRSPYQTRATFFPLHLRSPFGPWYGPLSSNG